MDKADMTLRALRKIIAEYCASEAIEDGHLQHGIDGLAQTIERQAAEIERLRCELLSLQNMERTVLAWFQCQLDYAAHEGESRPYSMAYSKLIEDKIFNEHALKECLAARQSKGTHHE